MMTFSSNYMIAWLMMILVMICINIDVVKGDKESTKNTASVFSLEERNLLALGKIFEALEKLANAQAPSTKEDVTNNKLIALMSAVNDVQNSVKTMAEVVKQSTTDTHAKFESILPVIQSTQYSVEAFAKSTADAINRLQQTVAERIADLDSTDSSGGTSNPVTVRTTTTPAPTFTTANSEVCESPYFLVGDQCFRISRYERSWDSSKQKCQQDGGDLASPVSLDLLRQHLRFTGDTYDYWIGGHKVEGKWKWITGGPIEDEWREDQPSNRTGEECLDFRSGYWPSLNDYECHKEQKYICERTYTGATPPTLGPVECSEGALNVGRKCLSVSEDTLEWHDAVTACTNKGGKLLSLQDRSDLFLVHEYILSNHDGNTFWLGGSDIEDEGEWVWMDGTPFDNFPWRRPEPNNANGGEDCLQWGEHARHFNDADCDDNCKYICELEPLYLSTGTESETTMKDSVTETVIEDSATTPI